MAVNSDESLIDYWGNGSTTVGYVVPFRFLSAAHLVVTVEHEGVEVANLEHQAGFTIVTEGEDAKVKTTTPVSTSHKLVIRRNTPLVNQFEWENAATWRGETLERNFDWAVMAAIDANRRAEEALLSNYGATLRGPVGEKISQLPSSGQRASKVQAYDSNGAPALKSPAELWSEADTEIFGNLQTAIDAASEATVAKNEIKATSPALNLLLNRHALHWFDNQTLRYSDLTSGSAGKYVSYAAAGDSVVGSISSFNRYCNREGLRRFGPGVLHSRTFVGLSETKFLFSGQEGDPIYTGGAARIVDNYSYLPNGEFFSVPAGGSVTESIYDKTICTGFSKIKCFFGFRAGGGILTFTLSQPGATIASKSINTGSGTPGHLGVVEFDGSDGLLLNGHVELMVSSSVGVGHYVGSYVFLEKGWMNVSMQRGGSSITSQWVCPDANLNLFTTKMGVGLISYAFKEENPASIKPFMTRMATVLPQVSHLWLGCFPSPSPTDDSGNNEKLREKAIELGHGFYDMYRAMGGSSQMISELGWGEVANGVHGNELMWRQQASQLVHHLFNGHSQADSHLLPIYRSELRRDFLVRNTIRNASYHSYATHHKTPASNWNPVNGAGQTGASVNTPTPTSEFAIPMLDQAPFHLGYDFKATWIMETVLLGGMTAGMAFGCASPLAGGSSPSNIIVNGVWRMNSAQPAIWIQVAGGEINPFVRCLLHDGTALHQSSEVLLPANLNNGRGYMRNSGFHPPHFFGVHYISNGASSGKEIELYMAPLRSGSLGDEPFRPYRVAKWRFNVANGGAIAGAENVAAFRVTANSAVSAGYCEARILDLRIDLGGDPIAKNSFMPWGD